METKIKFLVILVLLFFTILQALRITGQRQKIHRILKNHHINYMMLDHEKKRLTDMRVWFTIKILAVIIVLFS